MARNFYFAWTLKAAREWLRVNCPDAQIESITLNKALAYQVTDAYRPGASFTGKTPLDALRNAGFTPMKHPYS